MNRPTAHARSSRPAPISSAIGAGLSAWGATHLYTMNLAGHDLAGYGSLALGLIAGRLTWNTLTARERRSLRRKAERAACRKSDTHGSSRWGSKSDAKKSGLLRPGGYYLGELNRRRLFYHGEGSSLVFGATGSGKSATSQICNLLLPRTDANGNLISKVIVDLKGDLFCVCAPYLRASGYTIQTLAPTYETLSRELDQAIPDDGYNPFRCLLHAGRDLKDEVHRISEILIPPLANASGSSVYFRQGGQEYLEFGMMSLAAMNDPAKMNLVELRRLLMSSTDDLDRLIATASESEAFNGSLKEIANKILQMKSTAGEEHSGIHNTATQSLRLYDGFGYLGEHVSTTTGIDGRRIKDRPTALFVVTDTKKSETLKPWLQLVVSNLIEEVVADRTNRRVEIYCDEFGNIYLPTIMRSLTLHRQQGLRYTLFTQTGTAQIREKYGEDGLRTLLGNLGTIQALGVRDRETLRYLSDIAGSMTVKEYSQNLSPPLDASSRFGFSSGASNQGRPLIRPEDIHRMPSSKQLVFIENLSPFLLDKPRYLDRSDLNGRAAPNPYYEQSHE